MFDHMVRTASKLSPSIISSAVFVAYLCLIQDELKFFSQMKKVLGMEIKTENVFNALENIDEDGDKLISKEEIIAFCNKNPDALEVLGVSSVQELCVAPASLALTHARPHTCLPSHMLTTGTATHSIPSEC
jgi:hypothetical protein